MRLLLNNGAAIDAIGGPENNETALSIALRQQDLRAFLVLLSGGIDRKNFVVIFFSVNGFSFVGFALFR
jgi:hypothetical protein